MKIDAKELIDDLIQRCELAIEKVKKLNSLSDTQLNWKSNPERWSIYENMEHLNRYGRFYLPEIEKRMKAGSGKKAVATFKSGLLGNYFALSMLPKEKLNTMKTFQSMNPAGSDLNRDALKELLSQLKQLIQLLNQSRQLHLGKIKTGISISSWIKLRLGDTFRVVIYHIQRHLVQMANVEAKLNASNQN